MPKKPPTPCTPPGVFVQSAAQLRGICMKLQKAKLIAVDTETTGLDWKKEKAIGMSLATRLVQPCHDCGGKMKACKTCKGVGEVEGIYSYFFFLPRPKEAGPLAGLLGSEKVEKVFHNAKFDLHFLKGAGYKVRGRIYDTFFLAKLSNENRSAKDSYKLKPLARDLFDKSAGDDKDELDEWLAKNKKTWKDLATAPKELLARYGANDARITYGLAEVLFADLKRQEIPMELIYREAEVLSMAFEMEERGIRVNKAFLEKYRGELAGEQAKLYAKLKKIVKRDFNPESGDQVRNIMLQLGWKPPKRWHPEDGHVFTEADYPTDEEALKTFDHPFSQTLQDHRRLGTIRSTFVEGMLERAVKDRDGWVIHTEYNTAGARSGRWSSSNPNLQNMDKESRVREAFVPRPGHVFLMFDYKQIEPVLFAYFSKSAKLIDAFQKGLDYHSFNAAAAFGIPYEKVGKDSKERKIAKVLGLAMMYQMGAEKTAKQMGVPVGEARAILARFHESFPEIKELQKKTTRVVEDRAVEVAKKVGRLEIKGRDTWIYDGEELPMRRVENWKNPSQPWFFVNKEAVEEYGYIKNPFGRLCRLRINDAYKALNRLIQGSAADLLKEAMKRCKEAGYLPLLQVHDELVFEIEKAKVKKAVAVIKKAMESLQEKFTTVPIKVDVAMATKNWAQEQDVKL